jgi:hypothetical protein
VKRYFSTGVNIILFYGLFSILFLWLPQLFTFRMFLLTIWPYYWDFQNLVLFWNPSIYISMNRLCLFYFYFRQDVEDSELAQSTSESGNDEFKSQPSP